MESSPKTAQPTESTGNIMCRLITSDLLLFKIETEKGNASALAGAFSFRINTLTAKHLENRDFQSKVPS
jgi:hypothetical protein